MPKSTLTYKLPDENFEYRVAMKGYEYYSAIREIKNELRNHRKYDKPLKETYEAIEEICKEINTEIEG
jgi:hypothetical protein